MLVLALSNISVDTAALRIGPICDQGRPAVVRLGYPTYPELATRSDLVAHRIAEARHPDLLEELEDLQLKRRALIEDVIAGLSTADTKLERELASLQSEIQTIRELLTWEESQIAQDASVLLTTLAKAALTSFVQPPSSNRENQSKPYDVVILDEASIVPIPYVLWVASLPASQLVIVGDFRQLPPVCRSTNEKALQYMKKDIFDFLGIPGIIDAGQWEPRLRILSNQRRMVPQISRLISGPVYGGLLKDAPQVSIREPVRTLPLKGQPVVLVDTSDINPLCLMDPTGQSHSRFNLLHSLLAIHVSALTSPAQGAVQWGIITPYVLEARVINRILSSTDLGERVGCSTIHRFQGSERTAIIMDIADSRGTRRPSQMVQGGHGSLAMRLLNVAISRARDKLVIIANRRWLRAHLSHDSLLYQVIDTIPAISVAELGPISVHGFRVVEPDQWLRELANALNKNTSTRTSLRIVSRTTQGALSLLRLSTLWQLSNPSCDQLSVTSCLLSQVNEQSRSSETELRRKVGTMSPSQESEQSELSERPSRQSCVPFGTVEIFAPDCGFQRNSGAASAGDTSSNAAAAHSINLSNLARNVRFKKGFNLGLDLVFIGDSTLFVRTPPKLTSASDPPLPGKHGNLPAANIPDARPSIETLSDAGLPAGAQSRHRPTHTSDFTQYCAIIENSDAVGLIKELVTQTKAPSAGGLEEFFSSMKCPFCGAPLRIRKGRTYFLACGKYPACKNTLHLEAEWIQAYLYQCAEQGSPVVCDNCGSQLVARKGPYGVFLACPKCRAKKDLGEII